MRIHLKSLRQKLIVCCLLLTLIPLIAIAIYGHSLTSSSLSQQALERSIHQVHLQAESIASALRQAEGDAMYLSALRSLNMLRQQSTPEQVALWTREVGQDLLVLASVRPMYYAIRLIDADGDEIVGARADGEHVSLIEDLQNRRGVPYFDQTLRLPQNRVYVSPFQAQDTSGAPYIHYAIRLPDGVLVIDLHAGWLLRALPAHSGADTWALIDQDAHFLVYPEGFDTQTIAQDVPRMLLGGRSFETVHSSYVYDTIYPTANPDDGVFWVIFRHTPLEVLYASISNFYNVALFLLVIAATVAVVLALFVSRLLVEPVKQLEAMTVQFGRDGIAPPLPEHLPGDEIGALTEAFVETAHELENKRRQEHRLIERLFHVQEEERKLIAYDLHDGPIQQMVGARIYLSNCLNAAPALDGEARDYLERGAVALSGAIIEGRRIIEGLRPAALDDLGLIAAVEELAQGTALAAGWELTLDLGPLPAEPEKTIAGTLYRIAQEALNNARNHACARHVGVSLRNGAGIHLAITDDGVGFDPDAQSREGRGLGMATMRERASLINGQCSIMSTRGGGTCVEVCVPATLEDVPNPPSPLNPLSHTSRSQSRSTLSAVRDGGERGSDDSSHDLTPFSCVGFSRAATSTVFAATSGRGAGGEGDSQPAHVNTDVNWKAAVSHD
jgi:signal transduction histidine kinase